MRVERDALIEGARRARGVAVLIDVFRAFSTACHAIAQEPLGYALVADSSAASRLRAARPAPFLIGKAEIGASLTYDIPSSPTLVERRRLVARTVIHRSDAGAKGALCALQADELLAAGFVNAAATARYILRERPPLVTLVSMGHDGLTPSREDELCAELLAALLRGGSFDLRPFMAELRGGPGRYLFDGDQREYPSADFLRCLAVDRFDFALRAEPLGDHARLSKLYT
jgi:2-phosphosulfolactate phosphatase